MSASFNIINEHSLFLKREEKLAWFKIMAIGKTENSQIYMKSFPRGLGQGTHFHLSYTLESFCLHWCLKINVLVEYIWKSNNNKQIKISRLNATKFPKNIFPNENCGRCKWILFAMSSSLNKASCNVLWIFQSVLEPWCICYWVVQLLDIATNWHDNI